MILFFFSPAHSAYHDRSRFKRVFMIFDEFSVFAGGQVLNLVNMGRGKGVHAVFGTQVRLNLYAWSAE